MSAQPAPAEPVAGLLKQALSLHHANRFGEAEVLYRRVLHRAPHHADALHLLGVLTAQSGKPGDAVPLLRQAVRAAPRHAAALANLGNALKDLGQPAEALPHYDRALACTPGDALTHTHRGQALGAMGRHAEALASHDRALALSPGLAEAHNNRGCSLRDLERPAEALAAFDEALARKPAFLPALVNRGHALADLSRPGEALACYERAIALRPDHAGAQAARAAVLRDQGAVKAALAGYTLAIALAPGNGALHHNHANLLHQAGQHRAALAGYDRALALGVDPPEAHYGRGNALADLGQPGEAIAAYDTALALRPGHAEAHWNRGLSRLRAGDYAGGLADYEWRWRRKGAAPQRHQNIPAWNGRTPLTGQRLLIHAEQGLGDTLQFCRYLPRLAAMGAEPWLEIQPPLKQLLTDFPGTAQVITPGEAIPRPSLQVPLLSLPLLLEVAGPENDGPYLQAAPAIAAHWAAALPHGPRIGLACSGSPTHTRDAARSVPLALFAPLLAHEASFFLAQDQCRPADAAFIAETGKIGDLRAELITFGETAGLLAGLDLLISVDTSVAHLAAAMGRPVWLLLPFLPDWRWGAAGETTGWYPSMRLFRQEKPGDWAGVLARVRQALTSAGA